MSASSGTSGDRPVGCGSPSGGRREVPARNRFKPRRDQTGGYSGAAIRHNDVTCPHPIAIINIRGVNEMGLLDPEFPVCVRSLIRREQPLPGALLRGIGPPQGVADDHVCDVTEEELHFRCGVAALDTCCVPGRVEVLDKSFSSARRAASVGFKRRGCRWLRSAWRTLPSRGAETLVQVLGLPDVPGGSKSGRHPLQKM